jgi:hypothetical protein
MSSEAPKPPRRVRGKPARYAALGFRFYTASRTKFDGTFLVHKAALEINRAASAWEVFQAAASALALAPDPCLVYHTSQDGFNLQIPQGESMATIPIQQIEILVTEGQGAAPLETRLAEPTLQPLKDALFELGCTSAKFIPIRRGGAIAALIMAGMMAGKKSSRSALRTYATIAEMAETGLEKTLAIQSAQRPMAELEAYTFISQAVAGQTDLEELYPIIHKAISQILGQVDLSIALYDASRQTIHIPYLYEHPNLLSLEPFPLGQGLNSILIRTGQPLLLNQDVENKARELGAIIVGQAPKSWLGVPLTVAEQPIGAMVVQDLATENRFNEDDQRLLMTLGPQIAISIYNAQLIEKSRITARRERTLHEVTSKIRSSTDMKTILASTASELGRALHLKSVTIEAGLKARSDGKASEGEPNGDRPQGGQTEDGEARAA